MLIDLRYALDQLRRAGDCPIGNGEHVARLQDCLSRAKDALERCLEEAQRIERETAAAAERLAAKAERHAHTGTD